MKNNNKKKTIMISLITGLLGAVSLSGCSFGDKPSNDNKNNDQTINDNQLNSFKDDCCYTLDNYVNIAAYRKAEADQITAIISQAKEDIMGAKTIIEADDILNVALEAIDEFKTDEDYRKTEVPTYENSTSTELSRKYEREGYFPLYNDMNFRQPIMVSKPLQVEKPYYYEENLIDIYDTKKTEHGWEIAQWASRFDLIGNGEETSGYTVTETRDTYGLEHTITSKGKTVNDVFVPAKKITLNTATGEFRLVSNCSVEYDSPRQSNDNWVHLLMQQNYTPSVDNHIASKESIVVDFQFTVNSCVNHLGSNYDPGKHTAQVVWYLSLRNKNPESPGYNQSIWFGLGVWDNRTAGQTTPEYINHDAGTGTLIVSPASSETYAARKGIQPRVGEEARICLDIVPIMREAFIAAKERGYLSNTNWDDIYICHTNFGFEMPGTFDIDVSYKHMGLFAKQKGKIELTFLFTC